IFVEYNNKVFIIERYNLTMGSYNPERLSRSKNAKGIYVATILMKPKKVLRSHVGDETHHVIALAR
ncbi:unnamed protein product, partial [marine sediment metagenome]